VRLERCEIVRSPSKEDKIQLIGEVRYDHRFLKRDRIWFEVSERYMEYLSETGNPWLACLIPVAVTLGEPLQISRPVDRVLFDNMQELMRVWKGWYPHLHIVPIEAEIIDSEPRKMLAKTASFFSGGVDSFHAVLHYDANVVSSSSIVIDDLVTIWGFDVPLRNINAFQRVRDSLQIAADEMGKELVIISSNLRDTHYQQADFSSLAHGAFLASAVLALENRYSKTLIPSSYAEKDLHPWGSHPRTDPLYSTKSTTFIHYGCEFDRVEKTKFIAQSDIALRALRVCWLSDSGENCGTCNKCYRTKVTLALVDALDRCTTFSDKRLDLNKVARIYSASQRDIIFLRNLQAAATKQGQEDIADAIDRSLQFSAYLDRRWLLPTFWQVKEYLQTKPTFWRFLRPLRKILKSIIARITGSYF
jgi:hypothetical protein